ncbi:MAG: MBL fold metallo-hydrolase [Mobilitalea sp.]
MSGILVKTLVLGALQTNCSVVSQTETREAIVFDPADNADLIEQYLKSNDLVCKAILLTHGHFDHILAARELAAITGAAIYAHEEEAALLANPNLNLSLKFSGKECSLIPDILLTDGQRLDIAGFNIQVIHTPGHTQGGACYYFMEHGVLISGDTLFLEEVGRADLPTGDFSTLIEAIQSKLMVLADTVIAYPGHGPKTTIGHERANNSYLYL